MGYRLIYIDDDVKEASTLKDGLITNGLLDIRAIKAANFEVQLKELLEQKESFDGIILDLKLDENQEGERKAFYTAPSLAQQLRSKSVSDAKEFQVEFPIFLLTSKSNLIHYYVSDTASHDLFDESFIKDGNIGTTGKEYEKQIYSIISAYKTIQEVESYEEILKVDIDEDLKFKVFEKLRENPSVSEIARFVYKQIIKKSGILIDEKILAARLGLDIELSENWNVLRDEVLSVIKYQGVYSDYYERWWMFSLNDWWKSLHKKPLASLTAEERVSILNKTFNLDLVAAKPIAKTRSTRFWTICQALEKPLDPLEGFRLKRSNPETWQDMEYITLQAFLDGKIKPKDIHPSEIKRFRDIKNRFSK